MGRARIFIGREREGKKKGRGLYVNSGRSLPNL